jgi:hypothetical protein
LIIITFGQLQQILMTGMGQLDREKKKIRGNRLLRGIKILSGPAQMFEPMDEVEGKKKNLGKSHFGLWADPKSGAPSRWPGFLKPKRSGGESGSPDQAGIIQEPGKPLFPPLGGRLQGKAPGQGRLEKPAVGPLCAVKQGKQSVG